ncbi:hypothetical protein Barb6XT_02931 [Bacteroidales bacterium Barb6XT]|nr:hypothetical protein Barb6XT_02931 [Bacteroidales bacterium Barb6XT]
MLPYKEYETLVFYSDLSYKAATCHKGMILVGKKGREFHFTHTFLWQSLRIVLIQWLYDLYGDRLRNVPCLRYRIERLFAMDEFISDFNAKGIGANIIFRYTPERGLYC